MPDVELLVISKLRKLNEIGIALSKEKNRRLLLEKILEGAQELTQADASSLFFVKDKVALSFEIMRTQKLGFKMGGSGESPVPFPDLPLFREDGSFEDAYTATYAVNHKTTVQVMQKQEEKGGFGGPKAYDAYTGYQTQSLLTIPLIDHHDEVIGVLQLLNCTDAATGQIIAFPEEAQHLAESLASQAAIALSNQRLIEELKDLFESIIKLIAAAIDEKSPSTGNHSKRLPLVAQMMAEAVNATQEGALKEQHFTAEQLYELKVAALLHDCGKLVIPDYVMEKETKLEGLFDRIDLIDLRFAVLESQEKYKEVNFEEELTFVHRCNSGAEVMTPENLTRLQQIASLTYTLQGKEVNLITKNELEYLSVLSGTLTAKERAIMQSHVSMTILMLDQLKFPPSLAQVPAIAGAHHERIDGQGYPRGLKGSEMSIAAKVLAISDVFEALTSPDRPYKKALPLSQVQQIMHQMVKEGHLDSDLFKILVEQKVYLRFGLEHLDPSQIDCE